MLWCPDWPVTAAAAAAKVAEHRPAAVVAANRVVACSATARAAGVRRGLRRREAQARCPQLAVLAPDVDRDARAFEPVVRFVNRYRAGPRRVADRIFSSCGIYEPLIIPNRSMLHTFESTGMLVRYVEARDGHSWENWRDRLQEALSWIYPGAQKFFYE